MGDSAGVVGPLKQVPVGAWSAPFYLIPFDENGNCTGPKSRDHLVGRLADPQVTNVVVFSHGWNNTPSDAIELYDRFFAGVLAAGAPHPLGGEFRPVFVGLVWPSIVLSTPWERGPKIAGGAGADAEPADWLQQRDTVAQAVPSAQRDRFVELVGKARLSEAEVTELATLLTPVWAGDGPVDELATNPDLEPAELTGIWQDLAAKWPKEPAAAGTGARTGGNRPPPGPFASPAAAPGGPTPGEPAAAGLLDFLDPRNIVRVTTVLMMKDRSGHVGGTGVARLLDGMLGSGQAPVHLVGHSYGGKVVLSGVCRMAAVTRAVESVLLLQPAMSHLCFAATVPGLRQPGGYRPALSWSRVRQPILATFSSHDVPLGRMFHLAVRRESDLGEVVIAAAPSRYAALGGYGPTVENPQVVQVPVAAPGSGYDRSAPRRVLGIESSAVIGGHGDINNEATWWMLADQLARAGEP